MTFDEVKTALEDDPRLYTKTNGINIWYLQRSSHKDKIIFVTNFLTEGCTLTERVFCILHNIKEPPKCPYCGSLKKFRNFRLKYDKTCGNKSCFVRAREEYNLQHYGVKNSAQREDVKKSMKETNIKRFGFPNAAQSDLIKNKMKETNLKKYGVEYVLQLEELIQKRKQTCLKKYGVENPQQNPEVVAKREETCFKQYGFKTNLQCEKNKNQVIETCLKKYGFKNAMKNPIIQQKARRTNKERYGCDYPGQTHMKNTDKLEPDYIKKHFMKGALLDRQGAMEFYNCTMDVFYKMKDLYFNNVAITQLEIFKWLKNSLGLEVISDTRMVIKPYELDIYIPDKSFAIEYDGLYWHSDKFKKDTFHLMKTRMCEEKGTHLFHIFENEWLNPVKRTIWESMIKNKLGQSSHKIYARNCVVKEISTEEYKQFTEENHIQSYCHASVKLGLYHDNDLVAVMSFGNPRYNKSYDWELLRFCNKINTNIVGGAGKLLKYFRRHHPGSIISYANRRWSNGGLYEKLGFRFLQETKPNYFYIKGLKLFSREKYQKHKLKDILEDFDESLTERVNMKLNGYHRIYDCGSLVYELK